MLGNTPVKLQIEVDPANRKQKKENNIPKRRKKNSLQLEEKSEENSVSTVEIIKEAKLTNSSAIELKEWEKFLELEGLLDYTY